MNTTRNTTIELSVNPDYVPNWGIWEAIRELLQNAADADAQGHTMSITRTKSGIIKIANAGAVLGRDTLLLGTTTKRDDDSQRGQFGEGYKLALLVLTRAGVQVVAHTQREIWTPVIEHSDRFGTDIVKVRIRTTDVAREGLTFLVKGVSDADWLLIQQRCLFLLPVPTADRAVVEGGSVLSGETYRGQLYSRGLSVGPLPDDYGFGYDLDNVSLDRDRKLADPWSLKWEVSRVLKRAVEQDLIPTDAVVRLLGTDTGEARALKDNVGYQDDEVLVDRVAADFAERYGPDAVPVIDTAQSVEAAHVGIRAVVVPPAMAAVVAQKTGDYQSNKAKMDTLPSRLYELDSLTEIERDTYRWAMALVDTVSGVLDKVDVQIVAFNSNNINGTYHTEGERVIVRVARRRLDERKNFISTFVHEVAHQSGLDGTVEHGRAIQDIFAELVATFIS